MRNDKATPDADCAEDEPEYLPALLERYILPRPVLAHGRFPLLQGSPVIAFLDEALDNVFGGTRHDCVVLAEGVWMRKWATEALTIRLQPPLLRVRGWSRSRRCLVVLIGQ